MNASRLSPLLAVAASSVFAVPAEWPQFRGPSRDGVSAETGLLKEWPKEGPPLAWQIKGLGKGMSSVAISGGKIFTISQRKGGQFVIALDLNSQKELWAARVSEKADDPNATPCIDGELVYAVSKDGKLLCCRVADGEEVWRKDFVADFGGKMMSGWGYSESPLIDGDKVIVTPGGNDAVLVALDKKTGEPVWKAPMPPDVGSKGGDGAGYTGAVISNAAGIRQYVTLIGRGVISVSAAGGKVLWHYNRVANGTANIPTPLAWDDYVFASSGYGTGAALLKIVKADAAAKGPATAPADEAKAADGAKKASALKAELEKAREARAKLSEGSAEYEKADAGVQSLKAELAKIEEGDASGGAGLAQVPGSPAKVEEQYFLAAGTFQNHHGGMVRLGDYIYAGTGHNNGFPICLNWKTGKIVWKKDRGPGSESAAMIAADGGLYFRYQDGTMALIGATPEGYAEKGAFKLASVDGPSWPHPAIHNGQLYLRSQDTLMCYDIRGK